MNMSDEQEEFARRARTRFDASVERLDAATRSRLNRARHDALAAGEARRPVARRALLPATGLVAAIAMLALLLRAPDTALAPAPDPLEADVALVAGDDLEMLEDLEFYYWMDQLNAANGS